MQGIRCLKSRACRGHDIEDQNHVIQFRIQNKRADIVHTHDTDDCAVIGKHRENVPFGFHQSFQESPQGIRLFYRDIIVFDQVAELLVHHHDGIVFLLRRASFHDNHGFIYVMFGNALADEARKRYDDHQRDEQFIAAGQFRNQEHPCQRRVHDSGKDASHADCDAVDRVNHGDACKVQDF